MNDTQLLNNGYPMLKVGFGVYKITDEDMPKVIQQAIETGYRAFDTAYFYGNEASLGQALKNSGLPREELFITSKVWNDHQGYEQTKAYFQRSLDNMGLDYFDLFLIHWPCEQNGRYIETYKALEDLYHEGKVKAIGVCNFKIHHLEKLMQETNIVPQINQIEVHPYFNQQDVQDFCDKHDITVTAWMPLMRNRGLLDDSTIQHIAQQHDKTPAQIVLRWHLAHNRIIIPKSQTPSRIKENFDLFNFNLELAEIAEIDSLNRNARQGKDPDDVSIGDLK
ncbi:MAG: aldo/keto reductase [Staphylococcus lugdunensis]|nr:aldo/keto reductase [Staphylococcus lugdunensis]